MLTGDGKALRTIVLALIAALALASCYLASRVAVVLAPAWMLPPIDWPSSDAAVRVKPRGNPGAAFGPDAYPVAARRAGHEGCVMAELLIDARGHVRDCRIVKSSEFEELDDRTCRIGRELSLTPGRNDSGDAVAAIFPLNIRWQLE